MPKGPKGQNRPRDTNQLAKYIVEIATGDRADQTPPDDGKDKAAVELGRKGGAARAASLTKKRKAEIARKAAKARWRM